MEVSDRIKALRLQASMTQKELGEKLDVSVVTIRNWELGMKKPSMAAIISLAQVFHVSTDYMLGVAPNYEKDNSLLSYNEKKLLTNYRALDEHGRKAVDTICLLEKSRIDAERSKNTPEPKQKSTYRKQTASRYIPKYITPTAAGFSAPLDGDEFEMLLVDNNVPTDADFAVRVQGDSMFPYIHDGETVYVRRDCELNNGDVGIFCVNGSMYCKQYYLDEERNLALVSANPDLKESNVYVSAESGMTVHCYGKVLLGYHIPLPDYFLDEE